MPRTNFRRLAFGDRVLICMRSLLKEARAVLYYNRHSILFFSLVQSPQIMRKKTNLVEQVIIFPKSRVTSPWVMYALLVQIFLIRLSLSENKADQITVDVGNYFSLLRSILRIERELYILFCFITFIIRFMKNIIISFIDIWQFLPRII